MPPVRLPPLIVVLALALQACTTATTAPPAPHPEGDAASRVEQPEPEPELTLNLPDQESCRCVREDETKPDPTFLERGFAALADGDHIEAVQYFQRYQRLETSPQSDWESAIAIAYVSMLPRGPFYDPEAARESFRKLRKVDTDGWELHETSQFMRQVLANFLTMYRHIDDLESANATLKADLEKREEALRRLRELTLGQKGAK